MCCTGSSKSSQCIYEQIKYYVYKCECTALVFLGIFSFQLVTDSNLEFDLCQMSIVTVSLIPSSHFRY